MYVPYLHLEESYYFSYCKIKSKLLFLLLYLLLVGCFVLRHGLVYPRLASTHKVAEDGPNLEIFLLLHPAC